MKIIDLLNKIANGEEVPKKIAIQNEVLIYNKDEILNLQDCYYMADEEDATWKIWAYELNDEVEILEEEKKIPEKIILTNGGLTLHKVEDEIEIDLQLSSIERTLCHKLNEIIDYLKSKGE